jgi:tetratricopeptide (TPR) repeat protein
MENIYNLFSEDFYKNKAVVKFEQALENVMHKRYIEAISLLKEAHNLDPLNAEYVYYYGLANYYVKGESSPFFKKAAILEPENEEYQLWYGISLYSELDYLLAKKVLLYAYSINQNNEKTKNYYIKTLNQLNEFAEAETFILENTGYHKASSQDLFELGYSYWNQGKVEEAEKSFEDSILKNKKNIISYYFLARIYAKNKELNKAIELLNNLKIECPEEEKMIESQISSFKMIEEDEF